MSEDIDNPSLLSTDDRAHITELLWGFVSPDAKTRHEAALKLTTGQNSLDRDRCNTITQVIRSDGFRSDEFVRRLIVADSLFLWSDNVNKYAKDWKVNNLEHGDRNAENVSLASADPDDRYRATNVYIRALLHGHGWKPSMNLLAAPTVCCNELMIQLKPEIAAATDLITRRLASRHQSHGFILDAVYETAIYDKDLLNLLLSQIKGHNGFPFGDLAYNGETITKTIGCMIANHPAALDQVIDRWRQANTKDRDSLFRCLARADGKLGRYGEELLEAAYARYQELGYGLEIIAGIAPSNEEAFEFVVNHIRKSEPEWMFIGKDVSMNKHEVMKTHPEYFDKNGNPDHKVIQHDRSGPFYYAIDEKQYRRGDAINAMCLFKAFPDQAIDSLIEAWEIFEEYDPDQGYQSERQSRICDALCSFGPAAIRALPLLRHELEHRDQLPEGENNICSIYSVLSVMGPAADEVLPLLEAEARELGEEPDDDEIFECMSEPALAHAICVLRGDDPQRYM